MYKVRATYLWREDMRFDFDHYFRVHVPLARRQHALGGLQVLRMEIETGATSLLDPAQGRSPLAYSLYFRTLDDIEAFRRYMQSPLTEPLKADVGRYTNCALEWTVSEVRELPPEE